MNFTRYIFLFIDKDGNTERATFIIDNNRFFDHMEEALYVLWELTLVDRENAWQDGVSATVDYCDTGFYTVLINRAERLVVIV